MTGTIFDLVQEEIPEGKEGFFEAAKRAPEPKDDSFLNSVKDYGKTLLKGSVEGVSKFGRIMGPTIGENPNILEKQTETLNELLPTEEGYGQRGLRRGLREAPTVLAFPGSKLSTLPRAIGAGFLGEGAKDLGLPEWAQTAAELTAYIGPDITKKLIEKGGNKELIESARKLGISDEALTPLLQSDFKQKWLTKLSPKRGATEEILKKSKSELSEGYSSIQKSKEASLPLSKKSADTLLKKLSHSLYEMPDEVRNKIKGDFKDLLNSGATGKDLMNFYSDVNHYLGDNAKQLSLLKEPIREAIRSISPELGKDFDLINNLHSKYYNIANKLKPNMKSDIKEAIFETSEAIGLLSSIVFGYAPTIIAFAGEKIGRKLSQQLLINPRFQQLSEKVVKALNENKFGVAKKLSDLLGDQIRKTSPETADKLDQLSIEDFEELSRHRKKSPTE